MLAYLMQINLVCRCRGLTFPANGPARENGILLILIVISEDIHVYLLLLVFSELPVLPFGVEGLVEDRKKIQPP